MAKIVTIDGRHKPSVEEIFDSAKEVLVDVVVAGYDEDGKVFMWSTDMEARDRAYLGGVVFNTTSSSSFCEWDKHSLPDQED